MQSCLMNQTVHFSFSWQQISVRFASVTGTDVTKYVIISNSSMFWLESLVPAKHYFSKSTQDLFSWNFTNFITTVVETARIMKLFTRLTKYYMYWTFVFSRLTQNFGIRISMAITLARSKFKRRRQGRKYQII